MEEPHLPLKLDRIDLRIAKEKLRAWKAAAVRADKKLSEWIRIACDEYLAKERKEKR
jgi:hypothetical protein